MRRPYVFAFATSIALLVIGVLTYLYWYGATPRTGERPNLRRGVPISIEISVWSQPLATITNTAEMNSIVEMLRAGRATPEHECKDRGKMVLHFADGDTTRLGFLPGHHRLRYEFRTNRGLFAVSRSQFLKALKSGGVDGRRIPTD